MGQTPFWINLLAGFGGLSLILAVGFLLHRLTTTTNRRAYLLATLAVVFICVTAATTIANVQGDAKAALSSLFVGGLSTIGWIFTILYLRQTATSPESREQLTKRATFYEESLKANQSLVNSVADLKHAFSTDAALYAQITAANQQIGTGLGDVVARIDSNLIPTLQANNVCETLAQQNRAQTTLQIIRHHMSDAELRDHRTAIRQRYPFGVVLTPQDARKYIEKMKNPDDSDDSKVGFAIQSVLNFFELVAILDCCDLLDRRLLCTYFGNIVPASFRKFEAFIEESQGAGVTRKNSSYVFFEKLAKNWPDYDKWRPVA